MKRGLIAYVSAVALAATLLAVLILLHDPIDLHGLKAWSGVAALIALTVLGEGLGVRAIAGQATFSVGLIPTVAMVPLFGPTVALTSRVISLILAQGLILKWPRIKWVFNSAQLSIAIGLASLVYLLLDGPVNYEEFEIFAILPALGGLVITYFVTNMLLVGGVLALDTGKKLKDIWRDIAPVTFANEVASSSYSLFAIFAFIQLDAIGLLVVLLPIFTVHHTYGLQQKLIRQHKEILQFTIRTIEAKDPYTSGHSLRVASLSRDLAKALELSSHKVEQVETAALLHDIGKIDFSYTELIGNPARLTDTERDLIRSHPERGAKLLANLSSLGQEVVEAVRHHHEHYDGNGYPGGLRGRDIPLAARIIMVTDTVDAMLSDRPYRNALSVGEVAAELRRLSGRQFDPSIVSKFLDQGMLERAARRAELDRTPLPSIDVEARARASAS